MASSRSSDTFCCATMATGGGCAVAMGKIAGGGCVVAMGMIAGGSCTGGLCSGTAATLGGIWGAIEILLETSFINNSFFSPYSYDGCAGCGCVYAYSLC